jgi:hypothetical protein
MGKGVAEGGDDLRLGSTQRGRQHLQIADAQMHLGCALATHGLDLLDEPGYSCGIRSLMRFESGYVDHDLGFSSNATNDLGQQPLRRHFVELSKLTEALQGDGTLASLVAGNTRGLERAARAFADIPQGESFATADIPQNVAGKARV